MLAPTLNAVELAFNPVKYGAVPDKPVMEVVIPSAFEAGHAPEGGHVLSAVVQFAPHDPKDRAAARPRCWRTRWRCWKTTRPACGTASPMWSS
ncbi:MAG: hypothetical protein HZT43_07660 [Exiguobacterium profundum]|nr:MAG: hypothetical protein HZT43_07660 [Exiguobacterium profundum]